MCTRVCRLQFLQLQLIRTLRHDALARPDSGHNRHLAPIFIASYHVAPLKLLARDQYVNDLFAFVVEHGLPGHEHDTLLFTSSEPYIRLHADAKLSSRIIDLEDRLRGARLWIDNGTHVHEGAAE